MTALLHYVHWQWSPDPGNVKSDKRHNCGIVPPLICPNTVRILGFQILEDRKIKRQQWTCVIKMLGTDIAAAWRDVVIPTQRPVRPRPDLGPRFNWLAEINGARNHSKEISNSSDNCEGTFGWRPEKICKSVLCCVCFSFPICICICISISAIQLITQEIN